MAESLISAVIAAKNLQVDRNISFKKNDTVKLDVVINADINGGAGDRQTSLSKIGNFRPFQLKNLTANIDRTAVQRKQSAQIREAQQAITRERVNEIKAQNPLKSPLEAQVGSKIDLSA